jgi:uncharacterized protein (DUF433 family)
MAIKVSAHFHSLRNDAAASRPSQCARLESRLRHRRGGGHARTDEAGSVANWKVVIHANFGLIKAMQTSLVVRIDPEIMSGTPCFAGTRVPARTLIDYFEGGNSLEEFLEDFPTVSREQAVALLEEASDLLLAS